MSSTWRPCASSGKASARRVTWPGPSISARSRCRWAARWSGRWGSGLLPSSSSPLASRMPCMAVTTSSLSRTVPPYLTGASCECRSCWAYWPIASPPAHANGTLRLQSSVGGGARRRSTHFNARASRGWLTSFVVARRHHQVAARPHWTSSYTLTTSQRWRAWGGSTRPVPKAATFGPSVCSLKAASPALLMAETTAAPAARCKSRWKMIGAAGHAN
mmetsp:Transcript_41651/g.138506  ORF Transcript_41651/g.138506 Transcript_41651/m.138506 type:complete len:217 (+) Transcript_41651:500-1150(+)